MPVRHPLHVLRHASLAACGILIFLTLSLSAGLSSLHAQSDDGVEKAKSLSRAFRSVAKKVIPTVVKVKTMTKARTIEGRRGSSSRDNPFRGTPFEDLFDNGFPEGRSQRRVPEQEGLGSGVIIDPSGIILTNDHVVEDADEVLIELSDGRQFKASDIKVDSQSDLAVLHIKANERLPAATLGDSDSLDIGDWVLAIGNPFDLDLTVSAGIISGKGRVLPSATRTNYLQTDAAINPGNSGGPLVNLDGEVVGINTAIFSSSGGYQGVGFAIPINLAKWVTDQLVKKGSVQRAYLGITIAELNDDKVARKLGLQRNQGVLVSEVLKDSPAARAGLHEGDVIVTFAGTKMTNPRQLQATVERLPLGSKQELEIVRDEKPLRLSVVLESMPHELFAEKSPARRSGRPRVEAAEFDAAGLGLQVTDLTDEVAKRLGYEGASGVLISGVDADSPAEKEGLRAGMVVLRVGGKSVNSVGDFKSALSGQSVEKGVMLLVRTPQGNRFVVLQSS